MRGRRKKPPFDPAEVCTVIKIEPGSGGVDAIAWAALLSRAYARWAERCGIGCESDQDGLIVFAPSGPYFSREAGVHRLCRTSPFDPGNRRHTAFAAVYINGATVDEQVRSYTLDPYTRVSEVNGNAGTDDAASVLDGDFSVFYPDAVA